MFKFFGHPLPLMKYSSYTAVANPESDGIHMHTSTETRASKSTYPTCTCTVDIMHIITLLIICDHPWQNHIAPKIVFELRPPLPTTTFELLILQI